MERFGCILEWYEFSLFVYLSPILAGLFFPSQNKIAGLLATLLVFASGFVVRPIGAIILGHMGDRYGRAKALKFTIMLMSIASIITGCIPTFSQVGMLAPALLIACRIMQGFCIGGEFAGSMIYLSESAADNKRALFSCMSNNGSNIGVLIAVLSCTLLSAWLSPSAMSQYGWRILFISGGVLGVTGLWLRRDLAETHVFEQLQEKIRQPYVPLLHVFNQNRKTILHISLLLAISACGSYTIMGFISTYLHQFLQVPLSKAYQIQTVFILITLGLVPGFAYLSDKVGRKPVLLCSLIGYLILAIPCFVLLQGMQAWFVLLPIIICYSAEQAVTPALMAEMFPGKGRYTGISVSYNIAMALIGGFSPVLNTYFINLLGDNLFIAYYIMACALVSLVIVVRYLPKTFGCGHDLVHN